MREHVALAEGKHGGLNPICKCGSTLMDRCWFMCDLREDRVWYRNEQVAASHACNKSRLHPRALWCYLCMEFTAVREFQEPHNLVYLDASYDVVGEHIKSIRIGRRS